MPSRNKQRGYEAEVALVKIAQEQGFAARRAWGSDGRAMGEDAKVDVEVESELWQCKRKKTAPGYLLDMIKLIRKGVVHGASFYFDRNGSWALVPAERYFALRAAAEGRGAGETVRGVEGESR